MSDDYHTKTFHFIFEPQRIYFAKISSGDKTEGEEKNNEKEDENDKNKEKSGENEKEDEDTMMMEVSESMLRIVNNTHSWTLYSADEDDPKNNSQDNSQLPTFSDKIEISGVRDNLDLFDYTNNIYQQVDKHRSSQNNRWKENHAIIYKQTPHEIPVIHSKNQSIINGVLILAVVSGVVLLVSMVGIVCLKKSFSSEKCCKGHQRSQRLSDDAAVHKTLITKKKDFLRKDKNYDLMAPNISHTILKGNERMLGGVDVRKDGNIAKRDAVTGRMVDERISEDCVERVDTQKVIMGEKNSSLCANISKKDILEWYI